MTKAQARFVCLLVGIMVFVGAKVTPHTLSSQQIIDLVNQDRIRHGLSELSVNPLLNLAAYSKARDMVENNYFAHVSPAGTNPWHWFKSLGYNYSYAGENLAEGFTSAHELEISWMQSPKHRANILSPFYSEIGLAIIKEDGTNVVVQFFATPEEKLTYEK